MTQMPRQSETSTQRVSEEIQRLANSIYEHHNYKSLSGEEKWMPADVAFDLARKLLKEKNARLSTR